MQTTIAAGGPATDTFEPQAAADLKVRADARAELERAINDGLTIGFGHLRFDFHDTRDSGPLALSVSPVEAPIGGCGIDGLTRTLTRQGYTPVRRFAEVDRDGRILRFTDGRIHDRITFNSLGHLLDAEGRTLRISNGQAEAPPAQSRLVPCRFE